MAEEFVPYEIDGEEFIGYLATPATDRHAHPAVLVAHAWRGQDQFARDKAKALARLGYIGFAVDLYGQRKEVSQEEAPEAMMPLFQDRQLLQKRIRTGYDVLRAQRGVETQKIGAIGFCFGGLTVIELLRSGADIKGAVSFHGLLGDRMENHQANTVPIAKDIKGSLLILHGYEDPLVSPQDIQAMQQEMTKAGVDWQMNIYGHTSHAFSNPAAKDPEHGMCFNAKASQRAWRAMENFFQEIFH